MELKTGIKLFLISNMYPSKEHIRYGVFVKNFESAIQDDFLVKKIVMTKKNTLIEKVFAYLTLYLKIFQLLFKANSRNLIYVHFPLHVAPALWLISFKFRKIVLNFHGSDLIHNSLFTKALSFFLKLILKHSNSVVPSEYYRDKLSQEFEVPNDRIFVYPSGGVNRERFYKTIRVVGEDFTLGFISNFIEGKGWKVLLEAIQILESKQLISHLKLIMIGDGEDLIKIEKMVSSLKSKVVILPNVEQSQLVEYYNLFDVFIFPTYRESLGLVGLEAMACGVPVIASKVGGPMGYTEEGYNGYLFPAKDKEELAKQIIKFYRLSKEEREKMVLNCIKTASNYDSIKVKNGLINFLKQIDQNI